MQLLEHARIHTLDPTLPTAETLVVEGGWILAVGGPELAEQFPAASRKDMGGGVILPGLTDAHMHLQTYVLGLKKIDCEVGTRTECLRRVAEQVRMAKPGEWIFGHGWNQNSWAEGFGTVADLDAIAPHNPVYLTAKSLHAGWANSQALGMAGITTSTPDPKDGFIQRNKSGNPTGILFEKAMDLMKAAIPEPDPEELAEIIRDIQPYLWKMGLTGLHDFDRRACFQALQYLHERDELKLRVLKSIPFDEMEDAIKLGLRTGFGDDTLRVGSVKIFGDGALGPCTAAMLESYLDDPQNCGILNAVVEELYDVGRLATDNGLSLAVHAIGDRTNRKVLDQFTRIRKYEQEKGYRPLRHRIEHVQILHPADAPRLAELDIIASMQPIHVVSDMEMADRYWGDRCRGAYALRTQLAHGAHLALGSDAPVDSPNPFLGLHAAITRRRTDGHPGLNGWYPEQRLTLLEALEGFTLGPAFAAGMENRLGCLKAGYLADLILLEKDPFTCDPDELLTMQPEAVMVGGDWVWQA